VTRPPLPAFIIGGAPRSGTTALAHVLDRHPRIAMARPFAPEPKVFLAQPPDLAAYRELFAGAPAGAVLGEKTTNYFESPAAREAIRSALPGVRMVFVLREPVARAYSNWLWTRANGLEQLPFAQAVDQEGSRPDPLAATRPHARPYAYLSRSRYGTLARPWVEAFGRDRVRFVVHEQLAGGGRAGALRDLQEFLGVEPADLGALPRGLPNEARTTGPPLDPAVAARLRERLAGEVRELAELTGLDVEVWGYR